MTNAPRIAEVSCTPIRFRPGDRILVRLRQSVDKQQRQQIHKTVQKWAGDHVEVLVIELPVLDLEIIQSPLG